MIEAGSKEVCKAAIRMSISTTRKEEDSLKEKYITVDIHTAAVDYGGEFITSVTKIVERAVVAAKREKLIKDNHKEEGAVAGAAREAVSQISQKAIGLNIGGKIGIARHEDHIAVALFVGIGLLHLNEVAMGLGHRAI
ncbi:MAG: HutP family protein [Eubacteriales bacterium]